MRCDCFTFFYERGIWYFQEITTFGFCIQVIDDILFYRYKEAHVSLSKRKKQYFLHFFYLFHLTKTILSLTYASN